jgi:hypothetical protein
MWRLRLVGCAVLAAALASLPTEAAASSLVVQTQSGAVSGIAVSAENEWRGFRTRRRRWARWGGSRLLRWFRGRGFVMRRSSRLRASSLMAAEEQSGPRIACI